MTMDLINALFTLMVAFRDGTWPNKGFEEAFRPDVVAKLAKLSPNFTKPIKGYLKGELIDPADLVLAIQDCITKYQKSAAPKASFIAVLKSFISYFRSESPTAIRALTKLSSQSSLPAVRQAFLSDEKLSQTPVKKQLLKLVPKLGGEVGQSALDMETAKTARDANPTLYKEYLALRNQFGKIWKAAISNIVRSSGHTTVPYSTVLKELDRMGLDHTMPLGFTGNIDADGKWYTADNKLVNGVPAAVMFPRVKMNPRPSADSTWIFRAVRPTGEMGNAFYTMETIKQNQQEKFAKAANFDPEKTRKKWLPLVKSFDIGSAASHAAVILELLYRTANRIGSLRPYNATSGFGVSSLLVKHITVMSTGAIKATYSGKDAVKTTFVVVPTDDPVARFLCTKVFPQLLKGKSPRDPVFAVPKKNGTLSPVGPGPVRSLFSKFAPGLNPHKLRTAKATELWNEYAGAVYAKYEGKRNQPTPKEVGDLVKTIASKAGKALNHVRRSADGTQTVTPSTALANYIDPGVVADFYRRFNVPIPKWLETKIETTEARSKRSGH